MDNKHAEILDLMCAINRLDGLYRLAAIKNGIKFNTLVFLCAIDDGKVHTQKQLNDEWLTPRTTINTIVKECIVNGYITMHSLEHSKEKGIDITAQGRAYIEETTRNIYLAEQNAMSMTKQEYPEPFIPSLQKFISSLESEFDKKVFQNEQH
jgi:hypothetical protein